MNPGRLPNALLRVRLRERRRSRSPGTRWWTGRSTTWPR